MRAGRGVLVRGDLSLGDRVVYEGPRPHIKGKSGEVVAFPDDARGRGFVRVNVDGFGFTECLIENVRKVT